MLAPNLAPALDRSLADLAQRLSSPDRQELLAALDHIARETKGDAKRISRLSDARVPKKARAAICAITPLGFPGPWLAAHQQLWEAGEKYEAVVRAATATAIHAVTSRALDDLPRYRTELLHNVLWLMTEAPSGKYTTRYRTAGAVQDPFAVLRHEHVYTRRALTAELLAANPADIEGMLRTRAVACVVTKDEHDRLSPFDNTHLGWARYAAAEVNVLDMSTGNAVDSRCLV